VFPTWEIREIVEVIKTMMKESESVKGGGDQRMRNVIDLKNENNSNKAT
jgi:hypothetical protein